MSAEKNARAATSVGGGHLETPHLLRRTNAGETSIARHRPPQKQTTLDFHCGLARPPASGRFVPDRQRPGTILCYAAKLDQHFVHEQVNAGNAFDVYTAARKTIATGVIEAVIRPVGFNSPVPALTSN